MPGRREHWDAVYRARDEQALTWFEPEARLSFELVSAYAGRADPVIDIGGGAARLVDALLEGGFTNLEVLDVSAAALAVSRSRLGAAAAQVRWTCADVTRWTPPKAAYALWHDRAVFHFLTRPEDRAAYVAAMDRALRPGGIAIIAAFAPEGPETCSGLPVVRYAPETLAATLEQLAPARFRPLEARRHLHRTPKGAEQPFQISVFRRAGPAGG